MNQQSCTGPSWRWMGLSRAGIKSKYIGHTCQGWEELMYVEAHLCLDGKCAAWMPYCFKSMAFWGTTANTWLWPSAGTGSWLTFILFGVNINEEPIQRQWQKASPSGNSIWPAEVVLLCFSLETAKGTPRRAFNCPTLQRTSPDCPFPESAWGHSKQSQWQQSQETFHTLTPQEEQIHQIHQDTTLTVQWNKIPTLREMWFIVTLLTT